jgi:hypothetical protein
MALFSSRYWAEAAVASKWVSKRPVSSQSDGIQHKIGSLAVRAEFERFTAAEEHPTLITAGLICSF